MRDLPRVTLPASVTSSPRPGGDPNIKVVTLDARGRVHVWSPPATAATDALAGTVLLRVDRQVPWRELESFLRNPRLGIHTARIAYRGKGDSERFLPCSAIGLGMHLDYERYEFEVLRIRLALQADGSGRCGEEIVDVSRSLSAWCTSLQARAAKEKVHGLIVELEVAPECSWGRVATAFEQLRAGGVSSTQVLVRLRGDEGAEMSTGGVEYDFYPGDASTATTREDEFIPWLPWREADEETLESEEPVPVPD